MQSRASTSVHAFIIPNTGSYTVLHTPIGMGSAAHAAAGLYPDFPESTKKKFFLTLSMFQGLSILSGKNMCASGVLADSGTI